MAFDTAFTYLVSTVVGAGIQRGFFAIAGVLARSSEAVLAARLASPTVEHAIEKGIELVTGWVVSSPLGYSVQSSWNRWGQLNNSVNDYFSPSHHSGP
jgi:hypothetical protein